MPIKMINTRFKKTTAAKKFKEPHVDESHIKKALGKAVGMPLGPELFRKPCKGLETYFIFSLIVHKKNPTCRLCILK